MNIPKQLRALTLALLAVWLLPTQGNAQIEDIFSSLASEVKEEKSPETKSDSTEVKSSSYEKLLKDATKAKGFITLHLKKGKLYIELPTQLLGTPMLYSGRVAQISNNADVIAGEMPYDPLMVQWSKDDTKLYLHQLSTRFHADPTSSIYPRFKDNHLQPILQAFEIKAWNPDSTAIVIDATDLFLTSKPPMTPFQKASPFDKLMGNKRLTGTFKKEYSSITGITAFPTNVNVSVRGVYTSLDDPFTAVVNGSLYLLPKEMMQPRLQDERIGYFTNSSMPITTEKMKMEYDRYITRWRLEPRPEDVAKMKAGQLVEPKKPIVFYFDNAFPKEWWPYIKEGIEDWQAAFEEAGFKNAIIGKPYPNDPNFNPTDARYSCIIYSTSRTANAMGPSWTDPRTGEILQASVYFYHNVLELLHSWRFTQTAAADPSARGTNYSIKVLGPMLRYLIAHEVGHTLGLMHNMGASAAYSIKDLRSPSFTSKWGTTPSIMDYARYNYVAQPEDGVKDFLPPRIGIYDKYAIRWGYKPIFSARSPQEEKKTLSKWIEEKAHDKRFFYGPQQILLVNDPTSLSEDLGDDRIEASRLGILNLKRTVEHLFNWTETKGKTYDDQEALLKDIEGQFRLFMGHCSTYIGGYQKLVPIQGQNTPKFIPVPRSKQLQALYFILDQVLDYPTWMTTNEVKKKLGKAESDFNRYMISTMSDLLYTSLLSRINATAELEEKEQPLTAADYMEALYQYVWQEHQGKDLGAVRNMQYIYVSQLVKELDLENKDRDKKTSTGKIAAQSVIFDYLLKARDLTKQRMAEATPHRGHYASIYYLIERALQK